jgi:hypothetical protein
MDIKFEGKYNKMGDNIIADLYRESIVKSSYIVLFCSIFFFFFKLCYYPEIYIN